MRDKIYFLSDLHLGATYFTDEHERERRLVKWLRMVAPTARAIYLLGDVLDYWYEYHTVVPRGFTRFFGALAELADEGVEITWFTGNHDIWIFGYLQQELGVKVIDGVLDTEIDGKRWVMCHGDGADTRKASFRFIRRVFRNKTCQKLFSAIHPRWTIPFAHRWSSSSRHSHAGEMEKAAFKGEKDVYTTFARNYMDARGHVDYFIFGHRHILVDYQLAADSRLIILGDWIDLMTYGEWDGKSLILKYFTHF